MATFVMGKGNHRGSLPFHRHVYPTARPPHPDNSGQSWSRCAQPPKHSTPGPSRPSCTRSGRESARMADYDSLIRVVEIRVTYLLGITVHPKVAVINPQHP